jgi:hypothetical protein
MRRAPRRTRVVAGAACLLGALLATAGTPARARAQDELPPSRADSLLDAGRWSEAEELLYAATRTHPRDPVARARLGRYLAMKGALRPGLVLVEEAEEFGLPAATARALARPIHDLIEWRGRAESAGRDSSIAVRAPSDAGSLLRYPLVRPGQADTVWAELVPRMIGTDSAFGPSPRLGIETLEGFVPALDVADWTLHLHADTRAALSALGRRYPVLRSPSGVRVLVAPGRVRPLATALRELAPRWWLLDLAHGLLVVR